MMLSPIGENVEINLLQNNFNKLKEFFTEELTKINSYMKYDLAVHVLLAILYITYAVIYIKLPTKIKRGTRMVTNTTKKHASFLIYILIGFCYFAIGGIAWKEFHHVKNNWEQIKLESFVTPTNMM